MTTMPTKAPSYKANGYAPPKRPKWRHLYGRKWNQYTKAFLARAENALCVRCLTIDRETPSQEVDHIVAHKGDVKLFWNKENHQALCKRCHSLKTVREDGGFGRKPSESGVAHTLNEHTAAVCPTSTQRP